MDLTQWLETLPENPSLALAVVAGLSVAAFVLARYGLARWVVRLTARSATQADDVLVNHLRPYRLAWLAPLLALYATARLLPAQQAFIGKAALFLILWIVALTLFALLSAINTLYERRSGYRGVSIAGYLDIAKLLILMVALVLSVSLLTGRSPIALLTGLGAVAAVLMLVFQNTILALVASVQIAANGLLREGDWVEVPSYDADGDVVNINLHTIKVRNWDMTYSVIPTHRIMDVSFRNWRGMVESGGRRIQRSILIDQLSIGFCSVETLRGLARIDLIGDWVSEHVAALEAYALAHRDHYDLPLDGPQVTNLEVFRAYTVAYLRSRPDIHTEGMPFLVRVLAPAPTGLPLEIYVFTKTTAWVAYEAIQSQIFEHLLAAATTFGLRVYQEPSGLDMQRWAGGAGGAGAHGPAARDLCVHQDDGLGGV
ncbi:MAG: mechanosensitive ion channel family protein [Anaerolineae bacterium]